MTQCKRTIYTQIFQQFLSALILKVTQTHLAQCSRSCTSEVILRIMTCKHIIVQSNSQSTTSKRFVIRLQTAWKWIQLGRIFEENCMKMKNNCECGRVGGGGGGGGRVPWAPYICYWIQFWTIIVGIKRGRFPIYSTLLLLSNTSQWIWYINHNTFIYYHEPSKTARTSVPLTYHHPPPPPPSSPTHFLSPWCYKILRQSNAALCWNYLVIGAELVYNA